jgi:hypothetical protein
MSMFFLVTILVLLLVATLLETVIPEVIGRLRSRRKDMADRERDSHVRAARSFTDYSQSIGNVAQGSAFRSDTDAGFRGDD